MRIISDFHDYYDGLQRIDEDRELLYVRKTVQEKMGHWPFPIIGRNLYHDIVVGSVIVGFCGSIFPAVRISSQLYTDFTMEEDRAISLVNEALDRMIPLGENKAYQVRRRERLIRQTKEFFGECHHKRGEFSQVFVKARQPIFKAYTFGHEFHIEYNCHLDSLHFGRFFDAAHAYQEIRMFMSNLGTPEKPIPKIDDKTMAQAKGFDKYSFRKDKGVR